MSACRMHLVGSMDATNPRWGPRAGPHDHSATAWRIMVGATAVFALAAMLVASCPTRDQADLDAGEPAHVETVAGAPTTTPGAPASTSTSTRMTMSTNDSAGGAGTTTVTSGEMRGQPRPVAGHAAHADNDPNNRSTNASYPPWSPLMSIPDAGVAPIRTEPDAPGRPSR